LEKMTRLLREPKIIPVESWDWKLKLRPLRKPKRGIYAIKRQRRRPRLRLKHGHVTRVADWPYSSFHRYVERGIYSLEWAAGDNVRNQKWNNADGGMRFAFPPYGPTALVNLDLQISYLRQLLANIVFQLTVEGLKDFFFN